MNVAKKNINIDFKSNVPTKEIPAQNRFQCKLKLPALYNLCRIKSTTSRLYTNILLYVGNAGSINIVYKIALVHNLPNNLRLRSFRCRKHTSYYTSIGCSFRNMLFRLLPCKGWYTLA